MAYTVIVITSTQTWNVPSDWNNSDNFIECIGPGGDGSTSSNSGGGGGGGAYAKKNNVTLTPGGTASVVVGTGGSQTDTNFNSVCIADAGKNASALTGGAGGTTAGSTGDTKYAGGNGATGTAGTPPATAGGGGAAGKTGAGSAGTSASYVSGGGQGGAGDGGTNSGSAPSGAGGDGANSTTGAAENGANYGGGGGGAGGAYTTPGNGAPGVVVVSYTALTSYATFEQTCFRVFDDDGAINSGTALAVENAGYYQVNAGDNIRLRLRVANTGTGADDIVRRLEFRQDGGSWTQITTGSNNVRLAASSEFADGDATTERLTATGTFSAGQGKESGSDTSSKSLTNGYDVEDEWCIAFQTAAEGHSYDFRVTNAGVALDTYTQTPTIAPLAYSQISEIIYPSIQLIGKYLEATIKTSSATYPAVIDIYNLDGSVQVASKSTTSTSYTRVRTDSSFGLAADTQYIARIGIADGGSVSVRGNIRII